MKRGKKLVLSRERLRIVAGQGTRQTAMDIYCLSGNCTNTDRCSVSCHLSCATCGPPPEY